MIERDDALKMSEGLSKSTEGLADIIESAVIMGVPEALGMDGPDWVGEYVGTYAKLAIEDRRDRAKRLAADGHSQRKIADALGVGQATVNRDLEDDPNESHDDLGTATSEATPSRNDSHESPTDPQPTGETAEQRQEHIDRVNRFATIELLYQVNNVAALINTDNGIDKIVALIVYRSDEYEEYAKQDVTELIGALRVIKDRAGMLLDKLE